MSRRGAILEGQLRARLERALGVGLGDIRLHTGPRAEAIARQADAEAVTVGRDAFFGAGRDPASPSCFELVAHEVVHVLQHDPGHGSATRPSDPRDACEIEARRAAALVVSGRAVGRGAVTRCAHRHAVHRHESFEHRLFGDVRPASLVSIARREEDRTGVLRTQRDLMAIWADDPAAVTPEEVRKRCPWIRTLRLKASGLLVTYGEINALPDYVASHASIDDLPERILLPILQYIREQTFGQMNRLLGVHEDRPFKHAVDEHFGHGRMGIIAKATQLDNLTKELGADRYKALVARNACHFAPYSWHRWQASHLIARDLAAAAGGNEDAARRAWVASGYADHFLQDSFASGHLVNKTRVMQFFVEWAASQHHVELADHALLASMTTTAQPEVAGRALYRGGYPGPSNDPQTSEERPTREERMRATKLEAGTGSLDAAYAGYLAFVDSVALQAASGFLHDHFNAQSVWVSSVAHASPFQVWGDATMLNGGEGVGICSETSQMSQAAIDELIANGLTSISVQEILDRFPTSVGERPSEPLVPLEDWNEGLRELCRDHIFPHVHADVVRFLRPRIGVISRDQAGKI